MLFLVITPKYTYLIDIEIKHIEKRNVSNVRIWRNSNKDVIENNVWKPKLN